MKIVKRIIFLLVVFLINLPLVSALSVDNTELTVAKGEKSTVDVYANLEEETTKVSFSLVYTTYDVPATF